MKLNNAAIFFAEFIVTFPLAKFLIIGDKKGKIIFFQFFVTFPVAKLKKIWE